MQNFDLFSKTSLHEFIEKHKWQLLGIAAFATGVYMTRRLVFAGPICTNKVRLDGKTAIVTGANTGIGKETALELAKRGAHVILACRDIKKAIIAAQEIRAKSGNGDVIVEQLDLSSLDSVKAFAKRIHANEKYVNILVNNAGVYCTPANWKTKDGYDLQFGVNYLGHFLLTNLLLDKLIESAPSRIINVTSKLYESMYINTFLEGYFKFVFAF